MGIGARAGPCWTPLEPRTATSSLGFITRLQLQKDLIHGTNALLMCVSPIPAAPRGALSVGIVPGSCGLDVNAELLTGSLCLCFHRPSQGV